MQTKPRFQEHYCLFDTPIGVCGVAWSNQGLTRLQLPEADKGATEERLRPHSASRAPEAPLRHIELVITKIQQYLSGTKADFSSVALDLSYIGPFYRKIYEAARSVGWGHTASYGELARQAGSPGAARAVGQAMARNPVPIIIPCHRILASGHKVGGFSAFGGIATKAHLLALEGAYVHAPKRAQQPSSFGQLSLSF